MKTCRMFNSTLEQMLDRKINIRDVLGMPDLDLEHLEYNYFTQIFKDGEQDDRVLRRLVKSGKRYYEIQIVPVRDENGHLMGIYSTGRDMTEVANSYRQQQENLLQLAKANEEVTSYINNINNIILRFCI